MKRVPVADDYRADVQALAAAVGPNTIGLYASAPTYSLGLVDPIEEIGALAQERDLWLHVDACVGGMLTPAVRRLGYEVAAYDFVIPGVTSISADLHKSGFAAKPASSAHFRSEALKEYARFSFDDWPSGLYSGVTFTGTRPGGAIAAAWAALNYLGEDGYDELAASSMRAKEAAVAGIGEIEGMQVHGNPPLWALSYGHDSIDVHAVAGRHAGARLALQPDDRAEGHSHDVHAGPRVHDAGLSRSAAGLGRPGRRWYRRWCGRAGPLLLGVS